MVMFGMTCIIATLLGIALIPSQRRRAIWGTIWFSVAFPAAVLLGLS